MTNRAIARVATLFTVLFIVLAVAQLRVQVIDGPRLAADPHNPRLANAAAGRGSIVAADGTVLAASAGSRRIYPAGGLAAHAVGYQSARYGTAGLEAAFDKFLAPPAPGADPLAALRAPVRGARVVTTIDPAVQRVLAAQLGLHRRAAGIVIDPHSGEILALASVPGFDPNTLDRDFPRLAGDPGSPLLDRSTSGLYPPGSTFKVVTAADALDLGLVSPETTFVDTGGLRVGNFTVRNDEEESTGTQNLAGAFALSSNVDFAQIALKIGAARWFDYAQRWGLGGSLDFDLPAARDRLPTPASVSDSILAQLGFGQADLLVTPLRMALVAATIAAGGVTPRPILVRAVESNGRTFTTPRGSLANPVSADTAATVRDMMVEVVRRGTGTGAALPGVTVAGKTGTATNPAGRAHAWFVAFAPAEAPRVAVAIIVENAGYGGTVSAPIARNVLRVALEHGQRR